jgi:transposase
MRKDSKAQAMRSADSCTLTVGLDLGDRWAQLCVLDQDGEILDEGRIKLTHQVLRTRFSNLGAARIALEAGTHSLWVSTLLVELGHEVIVANAREVTAITGSSRKSDRNDALKLTRYARVDPLILCPIQHRSVQSQIELSLIRARAALVRARTLLINTARGIAKPLGYRLPACTSKAFAAICRKRLPEPLSTALSPLMDQVEELTRQIEGYKQQIETVATARQAELAPLLSVRGVGTLTALTFVLTVGDKHRF